MLGVDIRIYAIFHTNQHSCCFLPCGIDVAFRPQPNGVPDQFTVDTTHDKEYFPTLGRHPNTESGLLNVPSVKLLTRYGLELGNLCLCKPDLVWHGGTFCYLFF